MYVAIDHCWIPYTISPISRIDLDCEEDDEYYDSIINNAQPSPLSDMNYECHSKLSEQIQYTLLDHSNTGCKNMSLSELAVYLYGTNEPISDRNCIYYYGGDV